MAIRDIIEEGDPILGKNCRHIIDFNDRLHILLDDMRETLIKANGLGLAAPQVGVLRRVCIIVDSPEESEELDDFVEPDESDSEDKDEDVDEDDDNEIVIIEMINPVILDSEEEQSGLEGCLSVPGVNGIVTRPKTVTVKAQDRHGKEFTFMCSNLTARAVCHEIDHLNGQLFTRLVEKYLTHEEVEEMRRENK